MTFLHEWKIGQRFSAYYNVVHALFLCRILSPINYAGKIGQSKVCLFRGTHSRGTRTWKIRSTSYHELQIFEDDRYMRYNLLQTVGK